MSPSLTLPRPSLTRARPPIAPILAVAAYLAVVLPLVPGAVRAPGHVPRLVAANDTAYGVTVEVLDGGARIPVGSVAAGHRATFREVADVGDRWALVWSARGREVTTTATRASLDDADWKVAVPDELGARLQSAGELPSP
jgi:hypothetical protein